MPFSREDRRVQNSKQDKVVFLKSPPSSTSMINGTQAIAILPNKQLGYYIKQKGSLWSSYFTNDGNQIVDKNLEIKQNLTVDNSVNVKGKVGIGEIAPEGNLHISSLTDATFILEADTDDNPEGDNPKIELRQDGNAVHGFLGIEGDAGSLYTNSLVNAVYLESKNNNSATSKIQFVTGGDYDAPSNGTARMTILATGQVGIGTNAPSTNADLTLESGVLNLKETTTPTADTNYGKIYTKNDNKLYFQDGAGNEYTVDITAV